MLKHLRKGIRVNDPPVPGDGLPPGTDPLLDFRKHARRAAGHPSELSDLVFAGSTPVRAGRTAEEQLSAFNREAASRSVRYYVELDLRWDSQFFIWVPAVDLDRAKEALSAMTSGPPVEPDTIDEA